MIVAEESIFFEAGSLELEGRLYLASGPDAVVITHPHPLYGGELDNLVVAALAKVYQQQGYSTLRFNFRGVGASEGAYDDGRGELNDLRAATEYLARFGKSVTDLAGYSFGAWISLRLTPPLATVRRLLLIAPPVAHLDFDSIQPASAELAVIVGDRDSFAPLNLLRQQMPLWHPSSRLNVLSAVDHFYRGAALEQLVNRVDAVLNGSLSG